MLYSNSSYHCNTLIRYSDCSDLAWNPKAVSWIISLGFLFTLVGSIQLHASELWVIGHPDLPIKTLTKDYLRDIFMGRIRTLPNGGRVTPVVMSHKASEHDVFIKHLIGITRKDWRANWAKLLFTGKGRPPKEYNNVQALIEEITKNPQAVGYVINESPPKSKVIILHHITWD